MQAYYEIEVQIPQNHQLQLSVPDSIPAGFAKIAVIYELPAVTERTEDKMTAFLQALPDVLGTPGLSRDEIKEIIQQERQNWD